ncbi:MAG: NAD(P)-dependent oxidoreductase [Solirubrobacteraceae bacterium]
MTDFVFGGQVRGSSQAMTVAFLGTGTMGLPMARNIAQCGHRVRAWNRSAERATALAADGVEVIKDLAEVAAGCDTLVTMLSSTVAVLDVASEALRHAPPDSVWIQMSTIGLEGTELCADLARERAAVLVDAPVLGTREPAHERQLVVLASGPEKARGRCEPIFSAVGSRTLWVGEAGAGTRAKLVVNSWVNGVVAVLAETIALARALDVEPDRFFEAVQGGALDLPYARLKGRQMIDEDFNAPAFRLELALKDAELVRDAGASVGLAQPVMDAVADRLGRAFEAGHGEKDMAATYLVRTS